MKKASALGRGLTMALVTVVVTNCGAILVYDVPIPPVTGYSQSDKVDLSVELRLTNEFNKPEGVTIPSAAICGRSPSSGLFIVDSSLAHWRHQGLAPAG
jgi:hypothetical protein